MQFTPEGIFTAIVTPFTAADEFDEPAFRRLIDFQIASGAAGLLVIGGSGEFVSLTPPARQPGIDLSIDPGSRPISILLGAPAPATPGGPQTARHAPQTPAPPGPAVAPYYIKA